MNNRQAFITLGAALLLLAIVPFVWGAVHGVPFGSDKQAWFLACGAAFADGIYRRRLGYGTRGYAVFAFTVFPGYALAMWAGGFSRVYEPSVWAASLWVDLFAYVGTACFLRGTKGAPEGCEADGVQA